MEKTAHYYDKQVDENEKNPEKCNTIGNLRLHKNIRMEKNDLGDLCVDERTLLKRTGCEMHSCSSG